MSDMDLVFKRVDELLDLFSGEVSEASSLRAVVTASDGVFEICIRHKSDLNGRAHDPRFLVHADSLDAALAKLAERLLSGLATRVTCLESDAKRSRAQAERAEHSLQHARIYAAKLRAKTIETVASWAEVK